MLFRKITTFIFSALLSQLAFSQQWQWAEGINIPYGLGVKMAAAPSGNFYVIGYNAEPNYGYPNGSFLIKYNSQGLELWRKIYSDPIRFYGVRVDATENILLAGDFKDTVTINSVSYITEQSVDGFLISLDSSGATNWFKQVAGKKDENAQDVHIDQAGSIYLTGAFSDQTTLAGDTLKTIGLYSSYVAKFDPAGNLQLMIATNTSSANVTNNGFRVRTDSLKNIYLLGDYNDVSIGTQSISDGSPYGAQYLAKLDSTGKFSFLISAATFTDKFRNFSICHGGIYLTGDGGWTTGGWSKTAKYDFNGNSSWTQMHGGFYAGFLNNNIIESSTGLYIIGYHEAPLIPSWTETYSLTLTNTTSSNQETCMDIKTSGAANGYDIIRTGMNEFIIIGSMPDTISFGSTSLYPSNGNTFLAKFKEGSDAIITSVAESKLRENGALIFPNPSKGEFNIQLADYTPGSSLCVYDATGNCIYSRDMSSGKETVDLKGQARGLYVLNIITPKGRTSKKIVLD